jgi:hypothetical protein
MVATAKDIMALHRYFMWGGEMAGHYRTLRDEARSDQERVDANFLRPYMPYWFATTYILIEGWKRLQLEDVTVDALLSKQEYVKLVKRYRHGVFHFHPEYYDPKFREMWDRGHESADWVLDVWNAFDRFFRAWFEAQRQAGVLPPLSLSSPP